MCSQRTRVKESIYDHSEMADRHLEDHPDNICVLQVPGTSGAVPEKRLARLGSNATESGNARKSRRHGIRMVHVQ